MKGDRRDFIRAGVGVGSLLIAGGGLSLLGKGLALLEDNSDPAVVRPPGAKGEVSFSASCIRCFQCGAICPNKAIKQMGLNRGVANMFTPYILPREQGCMLCMKCGEVCPTDALEKIADNADSIQARVRMGVAIVNPSLCYSYNGKTCGVCYYSCPFPDMALKLEIFAQPVIDVEKCVGCGLCERACIHIPQAVRVYPEARDA